MPADARTPPNNLRDIEKRLLALEHAHVRPETQASLYHMLPRGHVFPQFVSTSDSSTYSTSQDTDMTTTVALKANRRYGCRLLLPQVDFASVNTAAIWVIDLKVNGSVYRRLATYSFGSTGTFRFPVHAVREYVPATDGNYTFTIAVVEVADGATLQFVSAGVSSRERHLDVYDFGGVIT